MADSDEEGTSNAHLRGPLVKHLSAPAIAPPSTVITPSSATVLPSSSARRRARSPQSEADGLNSASHPKRVAVADEPLISNLLQHLMGLEVAFKAQSAQFDTRIAEQDSRIAVQDERIAMQEEKIVAQTQQLEEYRRKLEEAETKLEEAQTAHMLNEELIKDLREEIKFKTEEIAKLKEEMCKAEEKLEEITNQGGARIAEVEKKAQEQVEEANRLACAYEERAQRQVDELQSREALALQQVQDALQQAQLARTREAAVHQQLEDARRAAEEAEVYRQIRGVEDNENQMQLDEEAVASGHESTTGGMDVEDTVDHRSTGGMKEGEVGWRDEDEEAEGDSTRCDGRIGAGDRVVFESGGENAGNAQDSMTAAGALEVPSPPTPRTPTRHVPPPAQYRHSAARGCRFLSPLPQQESSTASPPAAPCLHEHCVPISAISSIVDQMKASSDPSSSPRQRQRPTALYFQKEIERNNDPVRTKFLADVRPHMNLLLRITKDIDILVSPARMEDSDAVGRFEAGETDEGPTLHPMQPSWTSIKGGWNRVLGMLFAEHLINTHGFEEEKKELIQAVFQERLDRLRALIRRNPRQDGETDAAYRARVKRGRPELNSNARVNARRATLFNRRCKVAGAARDDPEEAAVWEEVHQVVMALDANGMSSDESDYEDGSKTKTKVRSVPWRARGITSLMKAIDDDVGSTNAAGGQRAGNPGLKRSRERLPKASRRRAKRGLPVNYYDPDWYRQLSAQERLELGALPEKAFPHVDDVVL